MTKSKAHCGAKEIEQGIITLEEQIGNDFSDTAATRGTGEGHPGLLRLASWLADRHDSYCRLMKRIHKFIIAVSQKEKQLREDFGKDKRKQLQRKKNQKPQMKVLHQVQSMEGETTVNIMN